MLCLRRLVMRACLLLCAWCLHGQPAACTCASAAWLADATQVRTDSKCARADCRKMYAMFSATRSRQMPRFKFEVSCKPPWKTLRLAMLSVCAACKTSRFAMLPVRHNRRTAVRVSRSLLLPLVGLGGWRFARALLQDAWHG